MRKQNYRIGEVYQVYFPDGCGSVQAGWRPAVVFQNNLGNRHSPNLIVIPLTSKMKKTEQITHVILPKETSGLPKTSMALCENPQTVTKEFVGHYMTTLSDQQMNQIAKANLLAMAGIAFLQEQDVPQLINMAKQLNQTSFGAACG